MLNPDDLKQRLLDVQEESENIIKAAMAEDREELTEEENDKLEGLDVEYKSIEKQIKNIERVENRNAELSQSQGRVSDTDDAVHNSVEPKASAVQQARIRITEPPEVKRNNGFRSLGDFAKSVRASLRGNMDPRLVRNAPTTTSTEGVGADGGYLVPPDYRKEILNSIMGEDSLLARTDQWQTNSNTLIIPADETTPWQTSGGVQAYWESEAGQKTQSKLALKEKTVKLNKLTALIPVSEELLEDAGSLDSYLKKKIPEKFGFAINYALIHGTGAGEPQGIINCPSLVSIAEESAQDADTIVFENIVNMYSRMYGPLRSNAVWMINQDIEPQLFTMSFEGINSSVPAYMPANGLAGSPYATLMGRPVIPTQACSTLGDQGDIIFADWKQYLSATRTTGIRSDVSIHLWFDYDVVAFRFVMRIGGQAWWSSDIASLKGSSDMGAFIVLDARAG
jgi:HK97 family phage major capsid protein